MSLRARERGASAVEFALVVPILVVLLFGIIDYGLWFSNSLAAREGVREAARQGTVGNFGGSTACGPRGGSAHMRQLVCSAQKAIDPLAGVAYVKVVPPSTWAVGQTFTVCAVVVTKGLTGLTPMPNAGANSTVVPMTIEVASAGARERTSATAAPRGGWPRQCPP